MGNMAGHLMERILNRYLTGAYAVGAVDPSGIMRLYRPRYILRGANKLVCFRGQKVVHIDLDKIIRVVI